MECLFTCKWVTLSRILIPLFFSRKSAAGKILSQILIDFACILIAACVYLTTLFLTPHQFALAPLSLSPTRPLQSIVIIANCLGQKNLSEPHCYQWDSNPFVQIILLHPLKFIHLDIRFKSFAPYISVSGFAPWLKIKWTLSLSLFFIHFLFAQNEKDIWIFCFLSLKSFIVYWNFEREIKRCKTGFGWIARLTLDAAPQKS